VPLYPEWPTAPHKHSHGFWPNRLVVFLYINCMLHAETQLRHPNNEWEEWLLKRESMPIVLSWQ
jgi:hypothetical protein